MEEWLERTEMLLGRESLEKLRGSHIAVFGLGGVGGYLTESLARLGIGRLSLIDHDKITDTNRNRQIIATVKTIGLNKVDVMKERILDINPKAEVFTYPCFYLPGTGEIDFGDFDYIADAIDTVTAKIELVRMAQLHGIPIISCMGMGNKQDPSLIQAGDIYETSICPLAKVMRRELKKRRITKLQVVYSTEPPAKPGLPHDLSNNKKPIPGSISFVPPAAGLMMASEITRHLLKN